MPQATNDFRREGLYKHTQENALASRYIQPDRTYQAAWVKLDMDRAEACAAWIDQGMPRPHVMVGSNQSGRGHLLYGLKVPVVTSINGRLAPLKFMANVEAGFTRLMGADPAYGGHTVKTPLHPDWFTHLYDGPLYDLGDLINALPASISKRPIPRAEFVGVSRNIDLFDALRLWAYGEALGARRAGDYGRWEQEVARQAHDLNRFDVPLPLSEVRSTSRSVAAWTWRNAERLCGSVLGGIKRSRLRSWDRPEMTAQEARERMADGAERTHAVRRNRTFDAITGAIEELALQGITSPSPSQIAQLAGVSRHTVIRFRQAQPLGQGPTN